MSICDESKKHFDLSLLCMLNRFATMKLHKCNEVCLAEHPLWLFKNYFNNSGLALTAKEKIEILRYARTDIGRQVVQAYIDPLNREATMREHKCLGNEDLLKENPTWLVFHYIQFDGARIFREGKEARKLQCEGACK